MPCEEEKGGVRGRVSDIHGYGMDFIGLKVGIFVGDYAFWWLL